MSDNISDIKIRKRNYTYIGLSLILINLIYDMVEIGSGQFTDYSIGGIIGSNFLLLSGLFLIRLAHKLNQKLKNKNLFFE